MTKELWQTSAWYDGGVKKKEKMKERSLEQLMAEEPDPVEAAERAFSRLQGLQEFVFRVDVGDYPLTWFSSGETKKVRRYDRENKVWIQGDEPVGLPIQKDPKSQERGLRDLACRVIFNEREFLRREGCGDIADRIIRTGQARDPGTYIGNRRPDGKG